MSAAPEETGTMSVHGHGANDAARQRTAVFPAAHPGQHVSSALHTSDRIWSETNCYVDLWIEIINAFGSDPVAMLGFTLTQDFEGDQFTFFKMDLGDLDELYGIRATELAMFRGVESHVLTQIARGRMCLVDLDSYYLPDTQGTDYRTAHGKTSVGINRLDPQARSMEYFHNGGYYELSGDDYAGVFELDRGPEQPPFIPYVEFAAFPEEVPSGAHLKTVAREHLVKHYARRPASNPVRSYAEVFLTQLGELTGEDFDAFHKYAFNTSRQLGANFELAADHLAWLSEDFAEAASAARRLSEEAKSIQFRMARAVKRSTVETLDGVLEPAAQAWDELMGNLATRL